MLRKNYIVLILLFWISITYSQKKESISSNKKWQSKRSIKTTLQFERFLDSAVIFKKKNLEKSIDYITKSIETLGPQAEGEKLATALTELGKIYKYHKQYSLAITNFKDAIKANYTINRELLLAQTQLLNQNYTQAQSTYFSIQKNKNVSSYQKIDIYEGLGDSYKALGNDSNAQKEYTKGILIAKKIGASSKLSNLNSKIGDLFVTRNQLQRAEEYYDTSLKISDKETPKKAIQLKEKVADYYNRNNQYDNEIRLRKETIVKLEEAKNVPTKVNSKISDEEAFETMEEELAPTVKSKERITTQSTNLKIGIAYRAKKEYTDAITYLNKSITDAKATNDLVIEKDALKELAELYKVQKEYKKSLDTYEKYTVVAESLYVENEQEVTKTIASNQNIVTKQNKISNLEKDRQLFSSRSSLAKTEEQLIRESNKRQRLIIYSLIFGLLLMGLITYLFYKSNKQKEFANNLLALKSLRSQMNPHFIFNALNSVNNCIAKSDERSANRFLSDFSTLMRSVLENSEEDFIPLSKELKLLKLYTELEHSRFPDKFDYKITIDKHIDIESFQIPPMLLQPYIENAIWHGLRYKEEKGFLGIDLVAVDKETIRIKIEDNGIGRKKSLALKTQHQKKQKSKGMGNIKKRISVLNKMYKNKVAVTITDVTTNGSGTCVILKLKKEV